MNWLLNSPRYVRRSIALCIIAAGILFAGGLAAAVQSAMARDSAEVAEKRALLGRLIASNERFSTTAQDIPSEAAYVGTFLTGQSDTVILATLQEDLKAKAARNGVDVVSVGNAPALTRNDVVYLGLQINVTGKTGNLRDFLVSMETTTPLLFIPQLTMRSVGAANMRQQPVEQPLVAQLRVYAALDPGYRSSGSSDSSQ